MRKGCEVADARMVALNALNASGSELSVDSLVRAFLAPSSKLRETKQGRAFLRLHARLHMEPEKFSLELRRDVYDESTKAYAKAFQKALPRLDEIAVMRRLSYIIGAYLYAFSGTNRLEELTPSIHVKDDNDLEEMVSFFTAGMTQQS
ncbi:hypothetical protein [Halomonas sp. WWR20]